MNASAKPSLSRELLHYLHGIAHHSFGSLCSPTSTITARADDTSTLSTKPGDYYGSLHVSGRKRSYILHVPPSYDNKTNMPLVIVLHNGGGNAENIRTTTGFSTTADAFNSRPINKSPRW